MEKVRGKLMRWLMRALVSAKGRLEDWMPRFSRVGDARYFDPARFDWVPEIEASWRTIRAELDEVLSYRDELPNFQDISEDQACITSDDRWKTFFFYGYGFKAEGNCERCPRTAALLDRIPGMTTAFFSILAPHKHIPEHRGPYKGVLRYHLGLIVPDPPSSCGITVGGETRSWQEGRSLVFDDTFPHEAWNGSDDYRVVLFVDFVRPLRFPLSALNRSMICAVRLSPFIQDAKGNLLDWEERFQQLEEHRKEPVTG